jgi:uncharacterized membrane protein
VNRPPALALGALVAASAVLNALTSVHRYDTLHSGTYDLVIFDQAVRSYSRFHLPVAIVKGVHNGFGPDFAVLGDHFSPILALLAPLYWIHDDPRTLLVAQAVLFAAAIVPLGVFTRRELGTTAGYCVAGAYALSWPVAQAAAFDFHEVAFAPVILAVVFERLSAYRCGTGRWWHVALAAAALLAVKEDMGLLVAGFGLSLLVLARLRRETLLPGAAFVVGGLLYSAVATRVLIPAFGGRADYYWSYGRVVAHPFDALRLFVTPGVKVRTMLLLLGIGLAAPLASPYLLVVLPTLAERMLSDSPNWWRTDFHYDAFLVVPLLCAGVDGVARLRRTRAGARIGTAWAVAVLLAAVASVPLFAFDTVIGSGAWRRDAGAEADVAAAVRAARQVPDGALVEAADPVGPRLSARTRVLLWDRIPRGAPWVVADVERQRFPFCSLDDQRWRVDLLAAQGYRVVFAERGWVVLNRPGAVPDLRAPPAPPCP